MSDQFAANLSAEIGSVGSLPYSVKEFSSRDAARWDTYVTSVADGSFYHLSGWKSVIENTLHHQTYYLQCESDGEIKGVLPLAHVKSLLFGSALISVPFLVYGGVLSDDLTAQEMLVGRAIQIARELQVDYLEVRNRNSRVTSADPQCWRDGKSHVTFRKQIMPDPDLNLAAIPRKQRAMIRKGIKAGLKAEIDSDTERLYAALLECKRNLGTPFFNRKYLTAILDTFSDDVEILTVTHGNDLVSSVMSFRFRNEILPYYGGGGDLARSLKGSDFMYWAVMERACQDGVKIFDYGRSMIGSGAYRFKKHWGFEEEPLHYQYYLVAADSVPELSPNNPKYRFLVNRWKQLPLAVADLVGPPIARRLG